MISQDVIVLIAFIAYLVALAKILREKPNRNQPEHKIPKQESASTRITEEEEDLTQRLLEKARGDRE